jgi:diguanylate cyclase (GGDEF)-like protein
MEIECTVRYGGEEFAVLMPVTTCVEGTLTAERIRKEVKNEAFYPVPGEEVHITASIGVLEYRHGMDIKTLVRQADKLMYQAKKDGKDRTCTSTAS